MCSLCASYTAGRIFSTIPRRSLAVPGGVFDGDHEKCPPDKKGGSPGWVTDTLAHSPTKSLPFPVPPRGLPASPLTSESGSECSSGCSCNNHPDTAYHDSLDFLLTLFPHKGLQALPYATHFSISPPDGAAVSCSFEGVILDYPGQPKTLYVDAKNAHLVGLRESIVALLDLADDTFGCAALIIALERTSPNLGDLIHSLMYVGGSVVTKPLFDVDPAFVLVGLEI